MPAHNGVAKQIAEYVAEHPGCTRADMLAALGRDMSDAMPTYARHAGLIFAAGPRCSQRYYQTQQQAQEADQGLREDAKRQRKEKVAEQHRKCNLRRRARRQANGARLINSRPGACVPIDADVVLRRDGGDAVTAKRSRALEIALRDGFAVRDSRGRIWPPGFVPSITEHDLKMAAKEATSSRVATETRDRLREEGRGIDMMTGLKPAGGQAIAHRRVPTMRSGPV
jgi:hypothetical protein